MARLSKTDYAYFERLAGKEITVSYTSTRSAVSEILKDKGILEPVKVTEVRQTADEDVISVVSVATKKLQKLIFRS